MRTHRWLIPVVSSAIGFVIGTSMTSTVLGRSAATIRPKSAADRRCAGYCDGVRGGLLQDAREIEPPGPISWTYQRFSISHPFHSVEEIEMCGGRPPDTLALHTCELSQDRACIAELARTAAASISLPESLDEPPPWSKR